MDASMQLDAWQEELEREHVPESEEFGLGTFIYRSERPLDARASRRRSPPGLPRSVIRSKGWVNL
ncbi:GTP-binding protein, partial [Methylobacterium radiotolerans]